MADLYTALQPHVDHWQQSLTAGGHVLSMESGTLPDIEAVPQHLWQGWGEASGGETQNEEGAGMGKGGSDGQRVSAYSVRREGPPGPSLSCTAPVDGGWLLPPTQDAQHETEEDVEVGQLAQGAIGVQGQDTRTEAAGGASGALTLDSDHAIRLAIVGLPNVVGGGMEAHSAAWLHPITQPLFAMGWLAGDVTDSTLFALRAMLFVASSAPILLLFLQGTDLYLPAPSTARVAVHSTHFNCSLVQGKSTLMNTLLGEERVLTGVIGCCIPPSSCIDRGLNSAPCTSSYICLCLSY